MRHLNPVSNACRSKILKKFSNRISHLKKKGSSGNQNYSKIYKRYGNINTGNEILLNSVSRISKLLAAWAKGQKLRFDDDRSRTIRV